MATYNKETFKRLFQSKFNLSKWQMLLQDYFHADKVRVSPEVLDEDAEDRKGYFLGSMTTRDNYELGFFYYEMEDGSVLRRKVGLRNLIRPYLGYGFDAALAVFNDGTNWRLSLICDLKEDATSTKRFTYVFGDEKAFYKTPILRFESLRTKANEFLEIKKAFSVEALSDDFFDEYRKQYAEFVKFLTGKEYVKKGNKWVEQETGEPDVQYFTSFKEDDKLVRDYIKKMMGRIVFLYFLQSKGWLADNLHYMHDLFYDASDEVKGNFLDKVLEPMFFGLLNTKLEDRSSAPLVNGVGVKYIPNADEIPYLNGGLFQQEKIDEVDSVFPAGMFQSLFDFFDSYNFTIDENDPNDAEVGVDPEMLGKIFENLLEDNKDKGAFYTPKEIVRYMCQESLTAYLQTGIEDAEVKEHIANFVKTNDVEELGGASSELAMSIDQKLIDVKICDPAIGSGAFPMGLLRELYACRKSIEIFEEDNAADIKRHIIQNNIYGVDIEKGAVDIARLRFWLALIIDEKEPMPLPNLDFKIMQGNSLLESYKGVDLDVTSKKLKTGKDTKKTRGVLSLGFEETDVQKTIQDLVKSYFSITDHTLRAQRRQQIDKYVKDYIKVCAEGNHEVQDAVDELEIPNDQFFLWHTYFADVFEQGGFDIVIGNPPYIGVKGHREIFEQVRLGNLGKYFIGKMDYLYFFFHLSLTMLKLNGVSSFITTNYYVTADGAVKLRKHLRVSSSLLSLINLGEMRLFENAPGQHNMITLFRRTEGDNKKDICRILDVHRTGALNEILFTDIITGKDAETVYSVSSQNMLFDGSECYIRLANSQSTSIDNILMKIQNGNQTIREICTINQGIVSGADYVSEKHLSKYPISSQKRDGIFVLDELHPSDASVLNTILHNSNDKTLLKVFFKNSDIGKYVTNEKSTKHILFLGKDIKNELMLKKLYPIIAEHIYAFKQILVDKRASLNEKTEQWFTLNRGTSHPEVFSKCKIVCPQRSKTNTFGYNECEWYAASDVFFLTNPKEGYDLKYILGLLNSKLYFMWLYSKGKRKGETLELTATPLSEIPIKKVADREMSSVVLLVDSIISAKKQGKNTSALENQIDFLVYHLYGLTYDEVLIVDPDTPISREEYEAYKEE